MLHRLQGISTSIERSIRAGFSRSFGWRIANPPQDLSLHLHGLSTSIKLSFLFGRECAMRGDLRARV
jgi:hypothetical protein